MSANSHPWDPFDQDVTAPGSSGATATMPRKAASGHAHLRKSNPVREVTPSTRMWLGKLPQDVRPINLIGQYPRVVNRIAEAWSSPAAFGELSTDLLFDFRGNRAGFPAEVVRELRALRHHFYWRPSPKK